MKNKTIIKALAFTIWFVMGIILVDCLFAGLSEADTVLNVLSLIMLVLFVCISIKTKCFLRITELKLSKNNKNSNQNEQNN
ncbi:MAG: hypothetical protein IJ759_07950 [Bacteroidales bacterium]|nr:hypothetical protein [Bacteroidales bacterium]